MSALKDKQKEDKGGVEFQVTEENTFFRQNNTNSEENVTKSPITLKPKGTMNDVFLPIKAPKQQLVDINFCHSCVPRIKLFLGFLRNRDNESLNLPFYISLMELLKGIVFWVL